jgi:hypothetical protein
MRWHRWLLIVGLGLSAGVASGCLRGRVLPEADLEPAGWPPAPGATSAAENAAPEAKSDYRVQGPISPMAVRTALNVKPVELRIGQTEPPAKPPEPPAEMLLRPAPPAKPDVPAVAAFRALVEQHPSDEVREQLKSHDPATRDLMLALLGSAACLEHNGLDRASPREVSALVEQLNGLALNLRGRAELAVDRMCFCSRIENFGKFQALAPDYRFQPGEETRVYVQVRNLASRTEAGRFATVLKGRLEVYDNRDRTKPVYIWDSEPRLDTSEAPRQDYFINVRFQVPPRCPPGTYTLWVQVEDLTAPPAGSAARSRVARRSLDFRVGDDPARPRSALAGATPAP